MKYQDVPRLSHVEEIHGHLVADPYRWLEDPDSRGTQSWQAAQDRLWRRHAAGLPSRERFRARLAELSVAGLTTPPVWRGDRSFHLAQSAGQEHPVLYCDGRPLLDPMELDPTGLTTLDEWQPSPDGGLLACQVSRRGDERAELSVLDVATGRVVDGPIGGCRYSPVAWLPGRRAFYYVRFRQGIHLRTEESDERVFTRGPVPYGLQISPDGRWLVVSAGSPGVDPAGEPGGDLSGNDVWVADLSGGDPARPRLRAAQEGVAARTAGAVGPDGRLYLVTDRDTPRRKLCVADPTTPSDWRELVAEDPAAVLCGCTVLDGDRLLVSWTRHAIGEISVHEATTGKRLATVPLPGNGTIGALTSRPGGGHEAWFTYTDAVTPAEVWRYDARLGTATRWSPPAPGIARHIGSGLTRDVGSGSSTVPCDGPGVESRQVEYVSADGTRVRMVVVAGPSTGGPRPTILTGYGGFGMALTPAYAADSLAWVESGGVLAVAGLRGGGEEGEAWHRDGMLDRKQNVFDDFVAAAEHLVDTGWTTPDRLAVWGESNGGLLVGAAMTQRPDLFAAVVCSAGLLDMVRYERSGLGPAWTGEYGSAGDPAQLPWLLAYSPYHHVAPGTAYPATLFTVSGADSRVDPMHARKMCAALQHATAGERPILLRHDPDTGHGARAASRSIALAADVLAFIAAHTSGHTPGHTPGHTSAHAPGHTSAHAPGHTSAHATGKAAGGSEPA